MKGKLIVFEGVSGTGKETQAKLLQSHLARKKIVSRIVFHPTPELKIILSEWRERRQIDHLTEVYLLLADRYDRVRQVIVPSLKRGEWVISLRNYVSALVYQGKTVTEKRWIRREFSRFEPKQDYLFWFDISPENSLARILKRHKETGEPLGKFETLGKLAQKRQKYQEVMQDIAHERIDAGKTIAEIHREIVKRCVD